MKNVSKDVRKIYHKQHTRRVNDKKSIDRFIKIYSTEFFKIPKKFFVNKKVLDAGCGSTGYFIIAINKLGAKDIH